ncbi:hypothetical protein ASD12_05760 [Mesorhizobium sp. Root102]|nr:hypothetical protein ASD12_05760 [Mesorhizobium sp. Root102]
MKWNLCDNTRSHSSEHAKKAAGTAVQGMIIFRLKDPAVSAFGPSERKRGSKKNARREAPGIL